MRPELVLSPLGHTWVLDLDGTIVAHNGHLTEAGDVLLPGVDAFLEQIPADDLIVLVTSRGAQHREVTEKFLADNGVRFDQIIFGAPMGERILVNDSKPSGLRTAIAVHVERDRGPQLQVRVDQAL